MKNTDLTQSSGSRRYLVAVVLGTALSAMGSGTAVASPRGEPAARAVTDIGRYCTACWRNARVRPDLWDDCTQEVFRRLTERVAPDLWNSALRGEGEERRELIRAIDTVKKRAQRGRKLLSASADFAVDSRAASDCRLADDRDAVQRAAGQILSERQQGIMRMSFEGWSVHDIAREMKLPAERVSDDKYKAVRKLRDYLAPTAPVT